MTITGALVTSTLASLAFIGCAMTNVVAEPDSPHVQGRRREVAINGKRIKTVDVHAHCVVPAALKLVNQPLEAPGLLMDDTSTRIGLFDSSWIW